MNISGMYITPSTKISQKSFDWLVSQTSSKEQSNLTILQNNYSGCLISINITNRKLSGNIPADIAGLISFAISKNCTMLYLDNNYPANSYLGLYITE